MLREEAAFGCEFTLDRPALGSDEPELVVDLAVLVRFLLHRPDRRAGVFAVEAGDDLGRQVAGGDALVRRLAADERQRGGEELEGGRAMSEMTHEEASGLGSMVGVSSRVRV
jgi:hypothetical protein